MACSAKCRFAHATLSNRLPAEGVQTTNVQTSLELQAESLPLYAFTKISMRATFEI